MFDNLRYGEQWLPFFYALLETLTHEILEKKWTEYRHKDS